jgi:hypothetical protein
VLVVPAEIALVIVVVTRIWSVAVDGVFFVVAGASNLAFGRGGASEAPAESK